MKYLFIVQGEGRGHLTQALSLQQKLQEEGHEVVGALVGKSPARELPRFFTERFTAHGSVVEQFRSPNFLPKSTGRRSNLLLSVLYNLLVMPCYVRSIFRLRRVVRQTETDVVVNFYELLAGLTYLLCQPRTPMVCIAHQYSFLHPGYQFPPDAHLVELFMLRFFTRLTCLGASKILALSLRDMQPARGITIVPPLLRQEVLALEPRRGSYLHGYLLRSSYAPQVIAWHRRHPDVEMHFFWDKRDAQEQTTFDGNLHFHRLDDQLFLRYMSCARAYATTAGFESVCEAIYLDKPLLMVPTHIEQMCNAHDTLLMATGVSANAFDLDRLLALADRLPVHNGVFRHWVHQADHIFIEQLSQPIPSRARPFQRLRRAAVACYSHAAVLFTRF